MWTTNQLTILTPREHRKPQKSQTKIHLSTRHTLCTRNQWTPLVPLIYSQIYVTIFVLPMAKLLHTPVKPTKTHNSFILFDKGLTLEKSAFQIFHSGNSTRINSFDKTKFSCFTLSPKQHYSFVRN